MSEAPVYPIYLDSDMVVSLLASVEGGVSFEAEVKRTAGESQTTDSSKGGKLGAGGLLSPILALELGGSRQSSGVAGSETVVGLVRRQTEASLFNQLRSRLRAENLIRSIDSPSLVPGDFVEIDGHVRRSSLGEALKALERFFKFAATTGAAQAPAAAVSRAQRRSKGKPAAPPAAVPKGSSDKDETLAISRALEEDLADAPYEDVVLEAAGGAHAIILLRRDVATAQILESLRFGRFKVLGKVTERHLEGESVSLLRRSFSAYLPDAVLEEALDELQTSGAIKLPVASVEVPGPSLEVLPLAVFV